LSEGEGCTRGMRERAVGDGHGKSEKESRRGWMKGKRRVITLQSAQSQFPFFGMLQWKGNFPGEAHVKTQSG